MSEWCWQTDRFHARSFHVRGVVAVLSVRMDSSGVKRCRERQCSEIGCRKFARINSISLQYCLIPYREILCYGAFFGMIVSVQGCSLMHSLASRNSKWTQNKTRKAINFKNHNVKQKRGVFRALFYSNCNILSINRTYVYNFSVRACFNVSTSLVLLDLESKKRICDSW